MYPNKPYIYASKNTQREMPPREQERGIELARLLFKEYSPCGFGDELRLEMCSTRGKIRMHLIPLNPKPRDQQLVNRMRSKSPLEFTDASNDMYSFKRGMDYVSLSRYFREEEQ